MTQCDPRKAVSFRGCSVGFVVSVNSRKDWQSCDPWAQWGLWGLHEAWQALTQRE